MNIFVLFEKKDEHFFFGFVLQIIVLMAIFAVCAANPQGFFNFLNPSYYLNFLLGLLSSPQSTNSSTTAAPSSTAANNTG